MNDSHSVTPAELEPEPDSTVPIRSARHSAGCMVQTAVNQENSLIFSKIARNRDAHLPLARQDVSGCEHPGRDALERDLAIGLP